MYVIMCKTLRHFDGSTRLDSSHPVYAAAGKEELLGWMQREPEIILRHLNNIVAEDVWELGDCSNTDAHLWNKAKTLERIYYGVFVKDKE